MNALEELHQEIDGSNWDVKSESIINAAFQKLNEKLSAAGDTELLNKSEKERWVFNFNKGPENGLSYKIAGTQKNDKGEDEHVQWPDKNQLTEDDFAYYHTRFKETKNIYAKTEYGLVLYYGNSSQMRDNREVIVLIDGNSAQTDH